MGASRQTAWSSTFLNRSSPGFDEIRGWSPKSHVDRNKPDYIFRYYAQYDRLNEILGYNLRVEPVQGTLVIKSGSVIAIKTLLLGEHEIAVVHYLRLTRTDLASDSAQ